MKVKVLCVIKNVYVLLCKIKNIGNGNSCKNEV